MFSNCNLLIIRVGKKKNGKRKTKNVINHHRLVQNNADRSRVDGLEFDLSRTVDRKISNSPET